MNVLEAIIYVRKNAEKPIPIEFLGCGVYNFGTAAILSTRKFDEALSIVRGHKLLNAFLRYIEWF